MSAAELAELLTDKRAFATFLHETEGAKEVRAFTRDLRNEIRELCQRNIDAAKEAGDLQNSMGIIRSCDLAPVKEQYDAISRKAEALRKRVDLPAQLAFLQQRTEQADRESEELSEKFLEGAVSLDDFVEQYQKLRLDYHRGTIKTVIVTPFLRLQRR